MSQGNYPHPFPSFQEKYFGKHAVPPLCIISTTYPTAHQHMLQLGQGFCFDNEAPTTISPVSKFARLTCTGHVGGSAARRLPEKDDESTDAGPQTPTAALSKHSSSVGSNASEEVGAGSRHCFRGERRLVISFESFGTLGKIIQKCGRKPDHEVIIPDGLCGSHRVYNENWRFRITHGEEILHDAEVGQYCCITWEITNVASKKVLSITETSADARKRSILGHTISSKVFREAMEERAVELSMQMEAEEDPSKQASIKTLISALRPRRFSEGLLVFGLQHYSVHEACMNKLNQEEG